MASMTMEERLQRMLSQPQRRQRGQVPMDQVQRALQFQREYVAETTDFNVSAVSDCSDSLARLRNDKREAREHRDMTWEDHIATTIRDEEIRVTTAKAKKLTQETTLLAQLKTDKDKWNMAVDLRLSEYLQTTLSVADEAVRREYLASRNTTGQTPLHRATKAKDPRLLKLLLSLDADVTLRDDAGRSVFHYAADIGHDEIFRVLVGASTPQTRSVLTQVDSTGSSLLHVAALHGHHVIMAVVLETLEFTKLLSILNLQTKKDGASALHLAAQHGHEQCLRLLLTTRGIRTDLLNVRGSNALHAVLQQTFNIDKLVQVFLDSLSSNTSEETNYTFDSHDDYTGHNCLHTAIIKNFTDVALALIRSKRVALNTSTREGGWSALHLAVMTEEIRIVKALVEAGAMVDSVDNDGQTPLLQACLGGQLDVVRTLLLAGANPAHQNKQGHSPLHFLAAFCRDPTLLTDVIGRGADVSAKSLKLNTPLHFAAMNGNEVATRVLLEHGASASEINEDKRSVVYLAKKWRHRAVEDLVKPPEERDESGSHGGPTPDGSSHSRHAVFGTSPGRRAAPFTTSSTAGMRSIGNSSHSSRMRTPMTTRSDDSDNDSIYSFDDEEIPEPSTPWPQTMRTLSRGNNGNPSQQQQRRQQCRTFGELRERFMASDPANSRAPLKPVVLAHQKERHAAELQAARDLLDAPAPLSDAQLTRFTRKLLTAPVHIPWELTVPTLESSLASNSDSGLQRKLKPSIRTNIGLLRDHLTHAQHLNWPRYAHQRVFRKDDQLP